MNTEKEPTGFPSKDKPWLKYYENRKGKCLDRNKSIYQHFIDVVNEFPEELVYIDYKSGERITYTELLKEVDRFASALSASGINTSSTVGLFSLNSCFETIIILGANKIGATLKFIDLDLSIKGLTECLIDVDILVLEDAFIDIEPAFNTKGILTVVYGSTKSQIRDNCVTYSDFISKGNDSASVNICCDNKKPSMIIYSSGSTGKAKPIVHSNNTVITAIEKMFYSDYPINNDNMLIKVIPSHIGLGSITTMLTSILSGTTFISVKSEYNIEKLAEAMFSLIKNYPVWSVEQNFETQKGLLVFASPYFSYYILNHIEQITDLSFVKGILLGGSKIDPVLLSQMNTAFRKKGMNVPICNGYGQNEMAGAIALNTVHYNKDGSAGYPVFNTVIRIVDKDTLEELPYNKTGLILEKSDSRFLYYYNLPDKTKNALVTLPDGTIWFNSTDLGYMDEDGFVFITGRTTRTVIRTDYKVSLENIEDKIKGLPEISNVAVVSINNGKTLIAFVSTDKLLNDAEIMEIIKEQSECSVLEMPDRVIQLKQMLYMNNGKIDYRTLEKIAEEKGE